MFNANNNNNGNGAQNIWDQMALFNQLTLRNILNGKNNLGTPELRAAVAAMTFEQRDNALVFLECNMRSWQDYLMAVVSRLLQMFVLFWTTFQQILYSTIKHSKITYVHVTTFLL